MLPKASANTTVNEAASAFSNTGVYVTLARATVVNVVSVETVVKPLAVQPKNLAPSIGSAVRVTVEPASTLTFAPSVTSAPLRVITPRSVAATVIS